jgi:hypothetical protein
MNERQTDNINCIANSLWMTKLIILKIIFIVLEDTILLTKTKDERQNQWVDKINCDKKKKTRKLSTLPKEKN